MPREKKEKKPKFYSAPEVEEAVKSILTKCASTFSHFQINDIQILFKNGKNKLGKKHVNFKIIKEPVSLSTSKKLILLVTDEWWNETGISSERTKALIEGLLTVTTDEEGEYAKRDYDITTFSELLENPEYDFSVFSKVLPGEAKPEKLELTAPNK